MRSLVCACAVALFAVLSTGCFRVGANEQAPMRRKGGFVGVGVGGGASSYDCDQRCRIRTSDVGFAGTIGSVVSPGAAISVDGRILYRASQPEYQHSEVGVSYRRWLLPFFWVSGGAGVVRQDSEALGDGTRRYGGALLGAAAYELLLSNYLTLDIRVDVGAGAIPGGSYIEGVGGVAFTLYTAPIVSAADDNLDLSVPGEEPDW